MFVDDVLNDDEEISDRFDIPPDWIIEILSSQQSPNSIINKIVFCLNHGTKLGWFIDIAENELIRTKTRGLNPLSQRFICPN